MMMFVALVVVEVATVAIDSAENFLIDYCENLAMEVDYDENDDLLVGGVAFD